MKELNPSVKQALIDINFIKRYEELSNKFNEERIPSEKRLRILDGEIVMNIFKTLGYDSEFEPKEKFFKIEKEGIDNYFFSAHIILYGGMVDLVWIVRDKNGELLLGSPWGVYSRRIIDVNYKIKKPIFGTYEDLDEIFEVSFKMYEDFKKAMTNQE